MSENLSEEKLPSVRDAVTKHRDRFRIVYDALQNSHKIQSEQYDKNRRDTSFEVGDSVYLDSENIKSLSTPGNPANKLQPRFLGPFKILERLGPLNYKLDLPPKSRIHPVFHVSKLRKHVPRDPEQFVNQDQEETIQEPLIPDNPAYYQAEYEVEKIVKHSKSTDGSLIFLVKWVGYPHSENTWQTADDLSNAQDLLDQYLSKHRVSL
jgi:hypothetical protein